MSANSVRPLRKLVIVEELEDSSDSSRSDTSESDEEFRIRAPNPPEYYHVQKLIKYIKSGDETATVVALCCLVDHDLTDEVNQRAIQDVGGLEVLINLLETSSIQCVQGSLCVLCELSKNNEIRQHITNLGGVPVLLKNLQYPAKDIQILVAETLYNLAQIHKARKYVRKFDGIPKLVDLIDVKETCLATEDEQLFPNVKVQICAVAAGIRALLSISKSRKNIGIMMKCGVIPLLTRLLRSGNMKVVIPTVGVIAQCTKDPSYQLAVQTESMIPELLKYLSYQEYPQLRQFCAAAIFNCAEDPLTRERIGQAEGLDPLINIAKDPKTRENKPLLTEVTGAIWKTAKHLENMLRFDQLGTVEVLTQLLESAEESEDVLTNAVGALSEFLKFNHNRETFRKSGGVQYLIC